MVPVFGERRCRNGRSCHTIAPTPATCAFRGAKTAKPLPAIEPRADYTSRTPAIIRLARSLWIAVGILVVWPAGHSQRNLLSPSHDVCRG